MKSMDLALDHSWQLALVTDKNHMFQSGDLQWDEGFTFLELCSLVDQKQIHLLPLQLDRARHGAENKGGTSEAELLDRGAMARARKLQVSRQSSRDAQDRRHAPPQGASCF